MMINTLGELGQLPAAKVYAEQEGAWVTLRINETSGMTADATLTPNQAAALADELREIAAAATAYSE